MRKSLLTNALMADVKIKEIRIKGTRCEVYNPDAKKVVWIYDKLDDARAIHVFAHWFQNWNSQPVVIRVDWLKTIELKIDHFANLGIGTIEVPVPACS